MKGVIKYAFANSLGTVLYIILIVNFIFFLDGWIVDGPKETLLAPIFMLTLLVFSVALVGSLVFGRPILWHIDGKKKDAVKLLIYTLAILFIFIVAAFLITLAITQGNVNMLPLADN